MKRSACLALLWTLALAAPAPALEALDLLSIPFPESRRDKEAGFDTTVIRESLTFTRVAVIPNRLPLFISEAEKWRRYNYKIIAKEFRGRGYDVVDYETSSDAFWQANLPMEDTGSSEEKYSKLASLLQADLLIQPYYGMSSDNKTYLVINHHRYLAVTTLQIYSAKLNKFFYRADMSGNSWYLQGWIGLGAMIGGLADTENPTAVILGSSGGALLDLLPSLIPRSWRYRTAFRRAGRKALAPFFAAFPAAGLRKPEEDSTP